MGEIIPDEVLDILPLSRPPKAAVGWRPLVALNDENRLVALRLADGETVAGGMTRRFALYGYPVTFWTWDPRFARVSQFIPGERPRVLAGRVEAVAWASVDGLDDWPVLLLTRETESGS